MQIRRINTNEAKLFFNCLKKIDRETKFMMLEPDERHFDEKKMKEILGDKDDYFIAAINDGEIIGFLSAQRGKYKRTRHSAYIVIGIRQEFQKQGGQRKSRSIPRPAPALPSSFSVHSYPKERAMRA